MSDPAAALPINLHEFEPLARARLSPMAYDYVAGGAGDEHTVRWNRERLDALRLQPRCLVDVSRLDTQATLLGETLPHPILLAPTALHRLLHPEGELATARAAGRTGTTMVVSTAASTPIEDIARTASAPLWFQLYLDRDRGFSRALIARAVAAGCRVLCFTVDTPLLGARDREHRHPTTLPTGVTFAHFTGRASREAGDPTLAGVFSATHDPSLSWDALEWVCAESRIPVVVKGVLAPADARLAIAHGAAGVIVSNHGGRNLDTVPATIDALPRVVEAVAGRVPVLMDGGIRRGTDVVKALALGARAVLIGRPYLWALATHGAEGVERVVSLLRAELEMAMALLGAPSLDRLGPSVLWPDAPSADD